MRIFSLILLLSSISLSAQISHAEFVELLKSAVNGDSTSQLKLGDFFGCGNEFTQTENSTEAFKWYKKAAEQGNAEAKNFVGLYYFDGWGVEKNIVEAFKWWRDAAENGDVTALYNIAWHYEHGDEGVTKNIVEAHAYFSIAGKSIYALRAKNSGFRSVHTTQAACYKIQELEYQMTPKQIEAAKVRSKEIFGDLEPKWWQLRWWQALFT